MQLAETETELVVRLQDGENFFEKLQSLGLCAGAIVSGIGMMRDVTLAFWNGREYIQHHVKGPVEVLSLQGNFSKKEGQSFLHCHVVLGQEDGSVVGGHLMRATVNVTNEIVIQKLSGIELDRKLEPNGLYGLYPTRHSPASMP